LCGQIRYAQSIRPSGVEIPESYDAEAGF
jgi:hypothetical protein